MIHETGWNATMASCIVKFHLRGDMLNRLIKAALNHRLLVVALAAFVMVYGLLIVRQIPVDVFPDLNRPVVTVLTECPGMAPEEVEALVTLPLENVMNGMPGVERTYASSGVTLSMVQVEFGWDTDIYRNRQLVAERLALVRDKLPKGITPLIGPVTSVLGEIELVGLTTTAEKTSLMDLRTYADWVVKPRLLAIPGIAQVLTMGGDIKQYQVLISAEKLKYYNFSLDDIEESLSHVSANTTGGFIESEKQEFLIRNIGRVQSVEDIENSMVGFHLGQAVLVKDIAKVQVAPRFKRGVASVNSHPGIVLGIAKQPDANTLALTTRISLAIEDLEKNAPSDVTFHKELFRQADFIQTAINNVKEVLRDGAVLVCCVLFLFLLNLRTTFITLTAIPLSFFLTFIIFKIFDMTINTMTLGGLAIAIGELVDDAIVDVENVFRRLKENKNTLCPQSTLKVVFQASSEVRNSIVFATLVVILVFLPLFQLSGIEGRLFIPLGIAYIVSLGASLLVSLTVTPVLCSYLLPSLKAVASHKPSAVVALLQKWDRRFLNWAFDNPKKVFVFVSVLVVGALATIPFMGHSLLPPFQETTALISVKASPGIALTASSAIGAQAEKIILEVPEVKAVARRTGRAEEDEHVIGTHVSELDISFNEGGRPRPLVLEDIRHRLQVIPGVFVSVGQPLAHRIDHMMSGVASQIAIKLFGPDLQALSLKAAEINDAIKDVPGLVDLQVEPQTRIPQSKIHLLREDAASQGVIAGYLVKSLEMALNGKAVAQVLDEQRTSDIFLRFDDESRSNLELIKEMPVRIKPDGTRVILSDVADIYESKGPNVINRENGRRRIIIQSNTSGRDVSSIVKDIAARIREKVTLPSGYFVRFDGQFESQKRASTIIGLMSLCSLGFIIALLYGYFRSLTLTLQILVTIPLAMIGGLFAIFFTTKTLSIATLIGFITLCGIAARNAIMMLSHFLHLMKEEGQTFSREMVIRGALERLTPVLMTSLTAMLALIPLALAAGQPGKEILHPLSIAIIGGLISSTLLDIVVTPTVFFLYGQKAAVKALQPKEQL